MRVHFALALAVALAACSYDPPASVDAPDAAPAGSVIAEVVAVTVWHQDSRDAMSNQWK